MPRTINKIKICRCGKPLKYVATRKMKHLGHNYVYYEVFQCDDYIHPINEIEIETNRNGHDIYKEIFEHSKVKDRINAPLTADI